MKEWTQPRTTTWVCENGIHLMLNTAIRNAAGRGHVEVVRLLLKDSRVNLAAGYNCGKLHKSSDRREAIRWAAYHGENHLVQRLLQECWENSASGIDSTALHKLSGGNLLPWESIKEFFSNARWIRFSPTGTLLGKGK